MGKAQSLILVLCLLVTVPVLAHPSHSSYAELDWNEAGSTLEVALRVVPEDLEQALTRAEGQPVVLQERDQDSSRVVQAYLATHFLVANDRGEKMPLSLVGMEISHNQTWIYFTVATGTGRPLTLDNRLMMETADSQINRVRRLWSAPDSTLVFHRGGTPQEI